MKVLSVRAERDRPWRHTIWVAEASILSKYNEVTSVVLAVAGEIHDPDSFCLRKQPDAKDTFHVVNEDYDRCAGVIEATDQEMEVLAAAGYRLIDLRSFRITDLLHLL
jgi:hypothetical protein